ncbi:hypothetical protein [Sagittula sp. NFXS13]
MIDLTSSAPNVHGATAHDALLDWGPQSQVIDSRSLINGQL